jgi:sugar lactone lactonase YvrE
VGTAGIVAPGYAPSLLVSGSPFGGIHGLRFGPDGGLFVASLAKQSIFRVDIATGAVTVAVPPPLGEADDVAFSPDGRLYWTAPDSGSIFANDADGQVRTVARGLKGINGIAFRSDGRLYASTVFDGDALYEIDPDGARSPRLILEGIGGLNGCDFGPDDRLYGPLWFGGQVARIDVDKAELAVIADGFMRPSAVKTGINGNLWVVDAGLGRLSNLERESGRTIATIALDPSVDGVAVNRDGRLYVTNMADNSIQEIDPGGGSVRDLIRGALCLPGGIGLDAGGHLHIADQYAYRTVDTASGAVRLVARRGGGDINIPSALSVGPRFVLLSSLRTRSVELRDGLTLERLETIEGFGFPYQAIEIPAGILVADHGAGALVLVTGAVGARQKRSVATGLEGPVALLPTDEGIYVVEADGGRVSHVDLSDWSRRTVADGLDSPEGIVRLNGRELLIAEVGKRRLVAVGLRGGGQRVVAENLPVGLKGPPGWPAAFFPTGIAVGRLGEIYFSSDLDSAIYRLTPV